ncbi:MAG: TcpQ domain-containing protein [Burkholderiales bacterium]|nr:TcpQ domain-containing protein [Burkholderiales bacterium]
MKARLLLLLALAAGTAHAAPPSYLAQADDATMSRLIARWAAREKQTFRWEAGYDIPIQEVATINTTAKLDSATDLLDAVFRVLDAAPKVAPQQAAISLVACHFEDRDPSWVVRDAKQPPCEKPLN